MQIKNEGLEACKRENKSQNFKKVWKSWDTYSVFLGVKKLASDWNRILERPGSDLCDWNGLRKPGTGKIVCNFS